jgi:hypothetical protein
MYAGAFVVAAEEYPARNAADFNQRQVKYPG